MKKLSAFLAFLLMLITVPMEAHAMGDLTITPWRVVFNGRDRSARVTLINLSAQTNVYRIGWMMTTALENGRYDQKKYDPEKDKDPHSLPHMIVFSPRQVTIEPQGQQTVRLSLRRPADLPPGEYRAHITFIKLADQGPVQQDPNATSVSMAVNVNYGFSIPVIVRQGEDRALKVSLNSPRLHAINGGSALEIDLHRDAGKFSSYGEVKVYWKPSKGDEVEVGSLNNVALYPEVQTRKLTVPLLKKYMITNGSIRVVYAGQLDSEGKIWDEKTFPVGK